MKLKFLIGAIIGIAAITAGVLLFLSNGSDNIHETVIAEKQTVLKEISLTGTVVPERSVTLAFEQAGRLTAIPAKKGDDVIAGQELARLDDTELRTEFERRSAGLRAEQASLEQLASARETERAKLQELERGPRDEEIKLAETKVINAEKTLSSANADLLQTRTKAETDITLLYQDIDDIINDAFVKADHAVNQQIDALFSDDASTNPKLTFNTLDGSVKNSVETQRVSISQTVTALNALANEAPSGHDALDGALGQTEANLKSIRLFLNELTNAVNGAINITQATLDTYYTNINTARTNINTVLTAITAQKQAITAQRSTNTSLVTAKELAVTSAENTIRTAQGELTLLIAGASAETLSAQRARLTQAERAITAQQSRVVQVESEIRAINAQLDKLVLRAPINGTITAVGVELGEVVSPQTEAFTVITGAQLHLEANIPEIYISDIRSGLAADVSLDAYGQGIVFPALVIAVDPAETLVNGVSTYTTAFAFDEFDSRIKPGMTATIKLVTGRRVNVVAVPVYAISTNADRSVVEILLSDQQTTARRYVETGLRGTNGLVEIISGLSEGEEVILKTGNQ